MGIASGDADADGDEDLFVTNIIGETFALYENDGTANFEDARSRWGLAQPTAAFTGFGTEWIDYDNDGCARSVRRPTAPSTSSSRSAASRRRSG